MHQAGSSGFPMAPPGGHGDGAMPTGSGQNYLRLAQQAAGAVNPLAMFSMYGGGMFGYPSPYGMWGQNVGWPGAGTDGALPCVSGPEQSGLQFHPSGPMTGQDAGGKDSEAARFPANPTAPGLSLPGQDSQPRNSLEKSQSFYQQSTGKSPGARQGPGVEQNGRQFSDRGSGLASDGQNNHGMPFSNDYFWRLFQSNMGIREAVGGGHHNHHQSSSSPVQCPEDDHKRTGDDGGDRSNGQSKSSGQTAKSADQASDDFRCRFGDKKFYTLRSLMIKQQEQFMFQVWELHRLYWFQNYLFDLHQHPEQVRWEGYLKAEKAQERVRHAPGQDQMQYMASLQELMQQFVEQSRQGNVMWPGHAPMRTGAGEKSGPACVDFVAPQVQAPPPARPFDLLPQPDRPKAMPHPTNAQAMADMHAAWFAKHYGSPAGSGKPQAPPTNTPNNATVSNGNITGHNTTTTNNHHNHNVNMPKEQNPPVEGPEPKGLFGDSMTAAQGVYASAFKAAAEAAGQWWWHDAARVFGMPMAHLPSMGHGNQDVGDRHRRDLGQELSSSRTENTKKNCRVHKEKPARRKKDVKHRREPSAPLSDGGSVSGKEEGSGEDNSTESSRQDAPCSRKPQRSPVKTVLSKKRRKTQKTTLPAKVRKKAKRVQHQSQQCESIGSGNSGSCDGGHDTGTTMRNNKDYPKAMANILLSLSPNKGGNLT